MQEKEPVKRHVQVPNQVGLKQGFEPYDLLVYTSIKRFMNSVTREAFPSISTLSTLTESSKRDVCNSIRKMSGKCFDVYRKGNKNVYVFSSKYKNFEPFSYEFLDNKSLSANEKAYLLAVQQFMFKDIEGVGKVSFSSKILSQLINLPEWEIWKYDRSLQEKGYLNIVKTRNRDRETGLPMKEKIYDLDALGQAIIWVLQDHEKRIQKNTEDISNMQKDIAMLKKLLKEKDKEMDALKKKMDMKDRGDVKLDL